MVFPLPSCTPGPDYLNITGVGGVDLQFFPEVTDVDGHGVLHPERLFAPHGAVDALGREHGAGGPHEQVQDVILPGG